MNQKLSHTLAFHQNKDKHSRNQSSSKQLSFGFSLLARVELARVEVARVKVP